MLEKSEDSIQKFFDKLRTAMNARERPKNLLLMKVLDAYDTVQMNVFNLDNCQTAAQER